MRADQASNSNGADRYEIASWIVGFGETVDLVVKPLERGLRERRDEPILRPEEAVHGARRGAGLVGDRTYGQRIGATVRHEPLGGSAERAACPFIVLSGAAHALTEYRNSVTLRRIIMARDAKEELMYVVVQHRIKDPGTAFARGERLIKNEGAPAGVQGLQFYPAEDGSAVTCLWEAPSVDVVQHYVDSVLGDSSDNTCYAVNEAQSFAARPDRLAEAPAMSS
jgi:hypothetical protein